MTFKDSRVSLDGLHQGAGLNLCNVWGNTERYDYTYSFRLPFLNFLFGDYRRNIEEVVAPFFLFELGLCGYRTHLISRIKKAHEKVFRELK